MILENKSQKNEDWEIHPEGTFGAVCADVYSIEKENRYFGQVNKWTGEKDDRRTIWKVVICFLTTEMIEIDGEQKPRYVSVWNNKSWHEKSRLRECIVGWKPKANADIIDLEDLIGEKALLTISHNDGWANVSNISGLPNGMPCPSIPSDFVRHDDKAVETENENVPEVETVSGDDLPF